MLHEVSPIAKIFRDNIKIISNECCKKSIYPIFS